MIDGIPKGNASGHKHHADNQGGGFLDFSRGQGSLAFFWMLAVILNIPVIIDNIDPARKEAKGNKATQEQPDRGWNKKSARKKGWNQQEQIFCPVLGPEKQQVIFHLKPDKQTNIQNQKSKFNHRVNTRQSGFTNKIVAQGHSLSPSDTAFGTSSCSQPALRSGRSFLTAYITLKY
jgi:hypothetical protein